MAHMRPTWSSVGTLLSRNAAPYRSVCSYLCGGNFQILSRRLLPTPRLEYRRQLSGGAAAEAADRPRSVLFFGADEFSLASLRAVAESPGLVSRLECVCSPNRSLRKGKRVPQPVVEYAAARGIPVHPYPHSDPDGPQGKWGGLPELAAEFDLGVAVSYGHLVPTSVLRSFRDGTLNVHPSRLPRHRGAAPIQHTILAGDTETAVMVIELSEGKFDHGGILHSVNHTVAPRITFAELRDELGAIGAEALVHTIANYDDLKATPTTQHTLSEAPSLAQKIDKSVGKVKWAEWTAAQFDRTFRATSHQTPLLFKFNGLDVQVLGVTEVAASELPPHIANEVSPPPGAARYDKRTRTVLVRCTDGWVGCTLFRLPNNPRLTAEGLANGYGIRKGGQFQDG